VIKDILELRYPKLVYWYPMPETDTYIEYPKLERIFVRGTKYIKPQLIHFLL
jgi:hypothetical protein